MIVVPLLVAVGALLLPWSSSPAPVPLGAGVVPEPVSLSAWAVLGPWLLLLPAAVGAAAVVTVVRGRSAQAAVALAGALAVGLAVGALLDRGPSPAPGAWLAGAAGLVALVVAGLRARGPVLVGVVGAAAGLLVAAPRPAESSGPFVRLTAAAPVLGTARETLLDVPAPARVGADPDGTPAIGLDGGLATVRHGRAEWAAVTDGVRTDGVVARVLGTADGLVATVEGAPGDLRIGLDARDGSGRRALVTGVVDEPSRVGPDGSVWLLAEGGGTRRLDLAHPPTGTVAAADLPVAAERLEGRDVVGALVPVPGGALHRAVQEDGSVQIVRHTADGPVVLAGTRDTTCGQTADPLRSVLRTGALGASADTVWFVQGRLDDARLYRLGPDGRLARVESPLPGLVAAVGASASGVLLHTDTGLWTAPDSAAVPLPEPTCPPASGAAAPPLRALTPLGETGPNRVGSPQDTAGTWVSGREADGVEVLELVRPDGTRSPLGSRDVRIRGVVVPDGAGGAWWLDRAPEDRIALVHGAPGREPVRYPPVADPGRRALVPDLGGRPPLLATSTGLLRIDGGLAVPVLRGEVTGGVVAADGRGAVVRDGRVTALDGTPLLGAATPRTATTPPLAVQVAHGVPAAELTLARPTVAYAEDGTLLVADEDVLLAVAPDGAARVVAQDARLDRTNAYPVPGGLVLSSGYGVLHRVEP